MKGPVYRSLHEKFLRDVAEEEERQARHRIKVRFTASHDVYPESYRVVCSCGWMSAPYADSELAEAVKDVHGRDAV